MDGIATLMRNVLFAMAFIMAIGFFVGNSLNNQDIEMFFMLGAFLIGTPYLLIKANSNKYKIDNN